MTFNGPVLSDFDVTKILALACIRSFMLLFLRSCYTMCLFLSKNISFVSTVMYNHETDSEASDDSCHSDDSIINFILAYIRENSEFIKNLSDNSSEEESTMCMVYREEPLADQEWFANYNLHGSHEQ